MQALRGAADISKDQIIDLSEADYYTRQRFETWNKENEKNMDEITDPVTGNVVRVPWSQHPVWKGSEVKIPLAIVERR